MTLEISTLRDRNREDEKKTSGKPKSAFTNLPRVESLGLQLAEVGNDGMEILSSKYSVTPLPLRTDALSMDPFSPLQFADEQPLRECLEAHLKGSARYAARHAASFFARKDTTPKALSEEVLHVSEGYPMGVGDSLEQALLNCAYRPHTLMRMFKLERSDK